jgi:hypothetical protein
MKKILLFFFILIFCIAVWYGESRKFVAFPNGKDVTVWKTYNNKCYIIAGKYYGLFKPSLDQAYIETTNTSSGVDLIWKESSDMILAQVDSGSMLHSNPLAKVQITDYNLNKIHNDSIYTYFDTKLKVKRYKKNINIVSVSINEMGAL